MRALLIALLVIALLIAGALLYANLVWLPTHGKPWLERTLTEHTKLRVTMDRLSFRFPLGWVAADVRVTDPSQRVPPLRLHHVHGQVAWWPLLRERRGRFVIFARLQSPVATSCRVRGEYDWDARTLSARLRIPQLELAPVREAWPRFVPVGVERGTFTCDVTVDVAPERPVQLAGTLALRQFMMTAQNPAARLQGHLAFSGTGRYEPATSRWLDYEGRLTLENGIM